MKTCNKCNQEKTLEEFYPRKDTKDGRRHSCRKCTDAYQKGWRAAVYDYPARQKKYKTKELYGITAGQYIEMTKAGCEVCGSFDRLHVDHDHSCCPGRKTCGKCIKGILCSGCNFAEGHLQSDPDRALKLYEYMARRTNGAN